MTDGTVYLLRWPRADGRLTAKYHVVANPDAADYEATVFDAPDVELACGLAVPMLTAADTASEIRTLHRGRLDWIVAEVVCRLCAHEAGLEDPAIDLLLRHTRWSVFQPSAHAYLKNTVT